jgi:antirestriction protein ArdC
MKQQINKMSKKEYQGRNQDVLQEVKENEGYKSNEWITFVQARMLGLKLVRAKGKGVKIWKIGKVKDKDGEEKTGDFGIAVVFNGDLVQKM